MKIIFPALSLLLLGSSLVAAEHTQVPHQVRQIDANSTPLPNTQNIQEIATQFLNNRNVIVDQNGKLEEKKKQFLSITNDWTQSLMLFYQNLMIHKHNINTNADQDNAIKGSLIAQFSALLSCNNPNEMSIWETINPDDDLKLWDQKAIFNPNKGWIPLKPTDLVSARHFLFLSHLAKRVDEKNQKDNPQTFNPQKSDELHLKRLALLQSNFNTGNDLTKKERQDLLNEFITLGYPNQLVEIIIGQETLAQDGICKELKELHFTDNTIYANAEDFIEMNQEMNQKTLNKKNKKNYQLPNVLKNLLEGREIILNHLLVNGKHQKQSCVAYANYMLKLAAKMENPQLFLNNILYNNNTKELHILPTDILEILNKNHLIQNIHSFEIIEKLQSQKEWEIANQIFTQTFFCQGISTETSKQMLEKIRDNGSLLKILYEKQADLGENFLAFWKTQPSFKKLKTDEEMKLQELEEMFQEKQKPNKKKQAKNKVIARIEEKQNNVEQQKSNIMVEPQKSNILSQLQNSPQQTQEKIIQLQTPEQQMIQQLEEMLLKYQGTMETMRKNDQNQKDLYNQDQQNYLKTIKNQNQEIENLQAKNNNLFGSLEKMQEENNNLFESLKKMQADNKKIDDHYYTENKNTHIEIKNLKDALKERDIQAEKDNETIQRLKKLLQGDDLMIEQEPLSQNPSQEELQKAATFQKKALHDPIRFHHHRLLVLHNDALKKKIQNLEGKLTVFLNQMNDLTQNNVQ